MCRDFCVRALLWGCVFCAQICYMPGFLRLMKGVYASRRECAIPAYHFWCFSMLSWKNFLPSIPFSAFQYAQLKELSPQHTIFGVSVCSAGRTLSPAYHFRRLSMLSWKTSLPSIPFSAFQYAQTEELSPQHTKPCILVC